ncbi:hypothetical protein ACHAWF_006688 [Thalassiosira exigua]
MFAGVWDLALSFGDGTDGDKDKCMSRPFGVALLIAGPDDLGGHQLFFSDPSGGFMRYKAKAIGVGSEGTQSALVGVQRGYDGGGGRGVGAGDVEVGDGRENLDGGRGIGAIDGGEGASQGHGRGGEGRVGTAVIPGDGQVREAMRGVREDATARGDTTGGWVGIGRTLALARAETNLQNNQPKPDEIVFVCPCYL